MGPSTPGAADNLPIEAASGRQNDLLTSVLESLTHPFYVVNVHDHRVEIANSAARRAGVIEGDKCYALAHRRGAPCDGESERCPLEQVRRSKEPYTVEHVHHDADGTERHMEVRGYPLFGADGEVSRVIEYTLDVTDRRRAEEARRQSDRRYRLLLDTLQEGIWVIDPEARTTFVNPCMARMLGYTVEEMQGRHVFEFTGERALDLAQSYLERRRQGIRETHDFEFVRKDGSLLFARVETAPILDEHGRYQGAIAGVEDMTAQREREQAVRETQAAVHEARLQEERRLDEVRRRREIARAMQGVLLALNSNRSLDQVVAYITAQGGQVLAGEWLAIYQGGGDGPWLLQAAEGPLTNDWDPSSCPATDQALQEAAVSRQPASVCVAPGGPAILAVPIIVNGQIYGGAVLGYAGASSLTADEIALAQIVGHHVALAVENARLREEAQQAAIVEERNRLARELHDSVTQALFVASLVAEVLPQVWQRDPEEAMKGLEEIRRVTKGALSDMRALLLELSPAELLQAGLDELIRQLTIAATSRTPVSVSLALEPVPRLPAEVQVTFYRVCQEALHNIIKHAEPRQVAVHLHAFPPFSAEQAETWRGQIVLQVSDDGLGFDTQDPAPDSMGLRIMHERAARIAARLAIETEPGEGTHVTLQWDSP